MEVVDDSGAPVELRGTKLRCLLATLALRPGHVVAADRLVEDLWGAEPPPNAANSLQALVSRLRRALPRDVVATRAHGYLLATAASNVDTVRFGELAAVGRRALSDGDAVAASAVLGEALALWRGDALSDFAFEEFAQPSIVRLAEERASVLEDRIEADLRCGRHAELVAELESAVSAQPLRERLRGQLMVALYRSGRQADALRQFQDARSTLAEELGLEPGPELRRLEQAVLAQDPDLDLDPAVPPSRPPRRRRRGNLRAPLTRTVGRDEEIAELQSMLEDARLVTLVGPGGVGKTRLAVETARALEERVADGAWFVDLTRVRRPEAVVPAIASAVEAADVPGYKSGSGSLDRLADALAGRDTLLVIDNCEHVVEEVAIAAEALLGACPGVRILATSREALQLPGEVIWQARPLPLAAAVSLFAERAAAANRDFVLAEQNEAVVAEICARVDGLPLAVELAAARVRAFPVAQIASGLEDRFRFLSAGSRTAHARQQSLRAVVDWSYDLLFADERHLFDRLSVFSGGCSLGAAIAVCADESLPAGDVPDLMARLVGKSVVVADTADGDARFTMLQTLAEYAGERLAAAGEQERLRDRHRSWFAELARGFHRAFRGEGAADWMRRVSSELDNLRSALLWAAEQADGEAALALATALAWCGLVQGRTSESLRLLEIGLGVPEDAASTAARCYALAWRSLLSVHAERPDPGPGADKVLALARQTGDDDLEAWMNLMFAEILDGHGDHDGARALMCDARAYYGVRTSAVDETTVALIDGTLALLDGDDGSAEAQFASCLERSAGSGLPQMELSSLMILSTLAESRGDYERAESLLVRAMRREVELRHRGREVTSLVRLASLAALKGDRVRAASLYEDAERAADATLTQPVFAQVLRKIALKLRQAGDLAGATDAARRALAVHERVVMLPGVVECLCLLGFLAEGSGDAGAAERYHRRALEASRRLPDRRAVALCAEGLAGVALMRGDLARCGALLGAAGRSRADAAGSGGAAPSRGWNTISLDDLEGARIEAALRERAGAEAVDAALEAGRRSTIEELVGR